MFSATLTDVSCGRTRPVPCPTHPMAEPKWHLPLPVFRRRDRVTSVWNPRNAYKNPPPPHTHTHTHTRAHILPLVAQVLTVTTPRPSALTETLLPYTQVPCHNPCERRVRSHGRTSRGAINCPYMLFCSFVCPSVGLAVVFCSHSAVPRHSDGTCRCGCIPPVRYLHKFNSACCLLQFVTHLAC